MAKLCYGLVSFWIIVFIGVLLLYLLKMGEEFMRKTRPVSIVPIFFSMSLWLMPLKKRWFVKKFSHT